MAIDKPLPCPLCGSHSYLREHRATENRYIECGRCHATTRRYGSEDEAITAWNMRKGMKKKDLEELSHAYGVGDEVGYKHTIARLKDERDVLKSDVNELHNQVEEMGKEMDELKSMLLEAENRAESARKEAFADFKEVDGW